MKKKSTPSRSMPPTVILVCSVYVSPPSSFQDSEESLYSLTGHLCRALGVGGCCQDTIHCSTFIPNGTSLLAKSIRPDHMYGCLDSKHIFKNKYVSIVFFPQLSYVTVIAGGIMVASSSKIMLLPFSLRLLCICFDGGLLRRVLLKNNDFQVRERWL